MVRDTLAAALTGRYTIEEQLGEGGMGSVWRARDHRHDRDVALKILRPELAAAVGAERFLREVRVTAALQHPNILPLFDSGEADGLPWYTMPYIAGETVRERLGREGVFPVGEALRIVRQVASALGHAHERGVVHRDVKPENILLSDGHAYITDFGIALAVLRADEGRLTGTRLWLGTPHYMSPEQASDAPVIDGRGDQWSLAAVLYEMLAGEPPHNASTIQALIARVMTELPTPLSTVRPGIPAAVDVAVMRALSKSAADRFPTAESFEAALAAIPPTTDPSLVLPVVPGTQRTTARRAAWFAAAAVIIVLGATAFAMTRGGAADPSEVVIAVVPCEDRTGDSTYAYIAEGLSETLVNRLTTLSDLRVVPRGIVRAAARPNVGHEELARTVHASHLITCSVAAAGEGLRVGAQLMQVDPPRELWADGGVASAGRLLGIEDSLVQGIVASVPVRVSDVERRRIAAGDTRDGEAQRLFLLGRHHWNRFTPNDIRTALGYFEQALSLDSTYTKAWVGVSMANIVLALTIREESPDIPIGRARRAIARGLAVRPDDAELYAQRALIAVWYDRDFAAARRDAERAVSLDPDLAAAHQALQHVLVAQGDLDGSLAAIDEALRLEPLSTILHIDRAMTLYLARRYTESAAHAEEIIVLDPMSVFGYLMRAHVAAVEGRRDDVVAAMDHASTLARGAAFVDENRAVAMAVLGDSAATRAILDDLVTSNRRLDAVVIGAGWGLIGEHDRAFEWLGRAERERSRYSTTVRVSPWFDPLRGDARFDGFVRRITTDAPTRS